MCRRPLNHSCSDESSYVSAPLRIAIIGSGISGLSAAWLLSRLHNVTLFERDDRIGGHSNTVDVSVASTGAGAALTCPVDTGFIVYNTASYPNLVALFKHLDVPTTEAEMGFAVSLDNGNYEYSGDGLRGMFGQPTNAFRLQHWRMITDTLRFFREAPELLTAPPDDALSLGTYLSAHGYSEAFITRHLLPMAAAIWSTPTADVMDFPAAAFVRFFSNHGLLQVANRPQWRTVVGGSRMYVHRVLADFKGHVATGSPVVAVRRTPAAVYVETADGEQTFDACVIAAHADDALTLMGDADENERRLLGAFRYAPNRAVLHTDPSFMPKRTKLWSSWNYLDAADQGKADAPPALAVTYWMNKLQPLQTKNDFFVTLNPPRPIADGKTVAAFNYAHPMFDHAALSAQRELWSLQGQRRTWFCGSYFGYGFHEDGLQSGLSVAEHIGGVRRPWTVAGENDRLQFGSSRLIVSPGATVEAAE